jgi:hypothetical protein
METEWTFRRFLPFIGCNSNLAACHIERIQHSPNKNMPIRGMNVQYLANDPQC